MTALSESSYPANGDLVSSSDSAPPAPVGSEQTPRAPRMPPYRRLNARERTSLLVEILSSYIQARKALRDEPIERAVATLRQHPGSGDPSGANTQTLIEAHRLARAVQRTLTLLPGDTRCLARSLVLTQLLARRGISSQLVIGARPAPSFLAHAWVEHAGLPVLPIGDGSFGRLVEL